MQLCKTQCSTNLKWLSLGAKTSSAPPNNARLSKVSNWVGCAVQGDICGIVACQSPASPGGNCFHSSDGRKTRAASLLLPSPLLRFLFFLGNVDCTDIFTRRPRLTTNSPVCVCKVSLPLSNQGSKQPPLHKDT